MAAGHGSKAVFKVQDSGAVLRDLSAWLTSTGLAKAADTAEVTTLGMTSKAFIPGLKDGTIPLDGIFDPTVDGYLDGILAMERPFEYYPQGAGVSGTPKYAGNGILTTYESSEPVDGAGTITGSFQITGNVTRTVQ